MATGKKTKITRGGRRRRKERKGEEKKGDRTI
jgi:hypothetical protein